MGTVKFKENLYEIVFFSKRSAGALRISRTSNMQNGSAARSGIWELKVGTGSNNTAFAGLVV